MSEHSTTPKTVELWIRSFAPASASPLTERALDGLDELEACESIESVEVRVWGKEVGQTRHTERIPHLRRIETRLQAFESWAARTGRRLEPFFRETHIESTITSECHDVWKLPTVALAEFDDDGDLLHVAPCRDGERTVDVVDRIDALVDDEERMSSVGGDGCTDEGTDQSSGGTTTYGQSRIEPFSSHSD
ncbi:HTH domain-containing protein [Natronorubrum halophilum]|uniref:HTH domain-containing protein n=1 Tax=Natronorubrum halophilum TaxID=1702106 RepID=UPI000EF670C0|nr:HTH domain-containing protein [Natronorubrum halophilum]